MKRVEIVGEEGTQAIIKEIFMHRGRICFIVENVFLKESPIGSFHNGYVQAKSKNHGKDYDPFIEKIETDELTFSGDYPGFSKDLWFFGFDSAHAWNDMKPDSKTFESVEKRTIELCNEMIEKGI